MSSHRQVSRLHRALSAILNGVWLGLLTREDLHAVSRSTYDDRSFYVTGDYNRRGLWEWETRAIEEHFAGRERLLVAAAGGGREVLALRRRGFVVDGFEAHPDLVRFANELLEEEGFGGRLRSAPWDESPDYDETYDGVIVGWGAYMHIRGRERRVRLLRRLRDRLLAGSPILLSFAARKNFPWTMRVAARIANAVSGLLGREPVEMGDWLEPSFTRYFTEEDIRDELRRAGFDLVEFVIDSGHAVGVAVDEPSER